jgi:hypothetical protein
MELHYFELSRRVSASSHFCLAFLRVYFPRGFPVRIVWAYACFVLCVAHTFHTPMAGSKVTCISDEFR